MAQDDNKTNESLDGQIELGAIRHPNHDDYLLTGKIIDLILANVELYSCKIEKGESPKFSLGLKSSKEGEEGAFISVAKMIANFRKDA